MITKLPRMTIGNWVFWAILVWIGVNFLWLALIERYVPQYVGAILATVAAAVVIRFGPRPLDGEEDEGNDQVWPE